MVALLALAHDRGCEAELAAALTEQMARAEPAKIDVAALQARFAPVPATDARHRRQPAAGRQLRFASPVAGSRRMNDSTSDTIKVDTARLPLLLRELRLPTIAAMWQSFTERADREGWPAARLLATLTELELAERDQRRIQRHLLEARLPPGKTLDSFDFTAVPMLSRAHVAALATGDGWIDRGGTILLFGPSGSGKSHLSAAFGHALIENGYRVLFTRTTDLVQRLQQARQALSLESAIEKLDKYHVLILEDLCYVRKDQAETSVLFELIAARYERRSLIVTANHPFGEWTSVFPDAAMTLAAVDRLVHHSTIFEMNVESYRRRVAAARAPRKPRGVSDSKSDSDSKRDNDSVNHADETSASPSCGDMFQMLGVRSLPFYINKY